MVTKITGIKNPSPYWLLKIMAITRLVLGHYSNISGLKSISNLLKFYCILVCFTFSLVYFWDVCNKKLMSFHSISIFENICISIIYFHHGDQLFTKFFSAIETNDRIVGFKNVSLIPIRHLDFQRSDENSQLSIICGFRVTFIYHIL